MNKKVVVMHKKLIASGLISLLLFAPVDGAIYKYVNEDGRVVYTNVKPHRAKKLETVERGCRTAPGGCKVAQTRKYKGVSSDWRNMPLRWEPYADEISAAAKEHGVDPALIRSIVHAESAFDPKAVSTAGAQGLMQLMPATAKRFGVQDSFDPVQNINGGVTYLKVLSKMFNNDIKLVSAAYNAGEGAVRKYKGIPPYGETETYVKRVTNLYKRYVKGQRG